MDARRNHLKEALTALADVLAKRPAEEILFEWFRSGRLVGELSVLIKRRHPECKPRLIASTRSIWRSSAKSGVTRQRKKIDCGKADTRHQWSGRHGSGSSKRNWMLR